jgi:Tfp pilus assembly protein PilF
MVYLQKGDVDQAINAFQRGLGVVPNYDVLHFNLGTAFAQQGKADEAKAEFKRTLQLNPKYPGAAESLARLRQQR